MHVIEQRQVRSHVVFIQFKILIHALVEKITSECKALYTTATLPQFCHTVDDARYAYDIFEANIGFADVFSRTVQEVEVDRWDKLLIDILGSLGFFMGFSMVTFIEFIIFFYTILANYVLKRK